MEVKTFSGGHVRFMSKAELQRYGDVVFVHYTGPRHAAVKGIAAATVPARGH